MPINNELLTKIRLNDAELSSLTLEGNELSKEDYVELANSLKNNQTIVDLKIEYARQDVDWPSLVSTVVKENAQLQTLSLYRCKTSLENWQQIASSLKGNKTLSSLKIITCELGDKGCDIIAPILTSTALRILELRGNQITSEGMKKIAQTLAENDFLEELDMGNNAISDSASPAIVEMLAQNSTLRKIAFETNDFSTIGYSAIMKAIRTEGIAQSTFGHSPDVKDSIDYARLHENFIQPMLLAIEKDDKAEILNQLLTHEEISGQFPQETLKQYQDYKEQMLAYLRLMLQEDGFPKKAASRIALWLGKDELTNYPNSLFVKTMSGHLSEDDKGTFLQCLQNDPAKLADILRQDIKEVAKFEGSCLQESGSNRLSSEEKISNIADKPTLFSQSKPKEKSSGSDLSNDASLGCS